MTLTGAIADINAFLDTIGAVKYLGAPNAFGQDAATLAYTASDGALSSSPVSVNVDINSVNDAPTATTRL